MPKPDSSTDTAVTRMDARFSDETLAEISDMNGALQALSDAGVMVESIDDYGNGFTVTDKQQLIGVPMLALEWRVNTGDMGDFVSVTAVTSDNRKVIFNDGSTGVRDQLMALTARRTAKGHKTPTKGVSFPRGLKRSDYTNADGLAGTTYYIG